MARTDALSQAENERAFSAMLEQANAGAVSDLSSPSLTDLSRFLPKAILEGGDGTLHVLGELLRYRLPMIKPKAARVQLCYRLTSDSPHASELYAGYLSTVPSLHRHCTVTAPSPHRHRTVTAPSPHRHCTVTAALLSQGTSHHVACKGSLMSLCFGAVTVQ